MPTSICVTEVYFDKLRKINDDRSGIGAHLYSIPLHWVQELARPEGDGASTIRGLRAGQRVDRLIGRQAIVIKPLDAVQLIRQTPAALETRAG